MEQWSIDKFAQKQAEEKKNLTPEELKKKIDNEKQLYRYKFAEDKDNLYIHIWKRENIDQPYTQYYVFITDIDMKPMIVFLIEQGYYITVKIDQKQEDYYMQFRSPFEIRTKQDFISKNIDLHNLVMLVNSFNADLSLNGLEKANNIRTILTSKPNNLVVDHICEQKFSILTTDIAEEYKTTPINLYTPQSNNKYNNLAFTKRKR